MVPPNGCQGRPHPWPPSPGPLPRYILEMGDCEGSGEKRWEVKWSLSRFKISNKNGNSSRLHFFPSPLLPQVVFRSTRSTAKKHLEQKKSFPPNHRMSSVWNEWRKETQESCPHVAPNLLSHSREGGRQEEGSDREEPSMYWCWELSSPGRAQTLGRDCEETGVSLTVWMAVCKTEKDECHGISLTCGI